MPKEQALELLTKLKDELHKLNDTQKGPAPKGLEGLEDRVALHFAEEGLMRTIELFNKGAFDGVLGAVAPVAEEVKQ